MARIPWGTGNRRIPIAIQGGTAIKLSSPDPSNLTLGSSIYRDSWTGMVCTPTTNRAVGDTTLTLNNTPIQSNFESGANLLTSRLLGLLFKFQGEFYRITVQTAGAITFVSTSGAAGLHAAMTANLSHIKIMAELPPVCSKLMIQPVGVDALYSHGQNTTAAGGAYFTIPSTMSELILDDDEGERAGPLFIVGSAAGTIEVQVYAL